MRNIVSTSVRFVVLLTVVAFAACGGKSATDTDGGALVCIANGISCATSDECCTGNCDPELAICTRVAAICSESGGACEVGLDCCSFACVDNTCSDAQCVSDSEACEVDGECCSGSCDSGTCTPLNNSCKTSGNSCSGDSDCCSKFCDDGLCSATPSFCTQPGDSCVDNTECCGGQCDVQDGASVGLCDLVPANGATSCLSAGAVCGGAYDGGALPICGGECCSRACLPYGPSGVLICQPPSGCRPTGEICADDSDCCGGPGNPDNDPSNVTCSKVDGNALGRCTNGNSCTPAGSICKLSTDSCNANANCCAGNTQVNDTCALDNLGIPRCVAAVIDCQDPSIYEGMDCASSADCCGLPCTPSGSGEFAPLICGTGCAGVGATCTNSADCCSGLPCQISAGSTSGVCGDVPADCADYGQTCDANADCCNNVPCLEGTCHVLIE